MDSIPMILVYAGVILVIVGLLWNLGSKIGLGSLPGDIRIEKENFRFYFPLTTSIIISLILSAIFLIIQRLR